MEVVFFNTDYEELLFSDDPHRIISNTKNQQLEFLAWLLGHETIYTQRDYKTDYLSFISSLTGITPRTQKKKAQIKTLWGNIEPLSEMRDLNSKITSTDFAIKNHLAHPSTRFEGGIMNLQEGELAKSPFSFSGRGHIVQNEKLQKDQLYIFEKKLKRTMDFSTLRFENKSIFYKNIVDDFFQYKGSLISSQNFYPHFLEEKIAKKYIEDINLITNHFDRGLEFQESYSIDSFLYSEEDQTKLYSLCEINYRSTMGKMAYLLSQKLFTNFNCHYLALSTKRVEIADNLNVLCLSPKDNKLHLYFMAAEDEKRVQDLAKILAI